MSKLIFSADDGRIEDIDLALLLNEYDIPAIFYIPNNCDLNEDQIKWLSNYFEIGGHTKNHPSDMKLLTDDQLKEEIEDNKAWLEEIIGRKVTSFCYPRGRFDERVKKAVKEAGYEEARTTRVLNEDYPIDNFEIETTLHLSYPWRKEYAGEDVWTMAMNYVDDYFDGNVKYLHFWLHSYELSKFSLWEQFETLLKYINLRRQNENTRESD